MAFAHVYQVVQNGSTAILGASEQRFTRAGAEGIQLAHAHEGVYFLYLHRSYGRGAEVQCTLHMRAYVSLGVDRCVDARRDLSTACPPARAGWPVS